MLLQVILEGLGLGALLILVCATGIRKGAVKMHHPNSPFADAHSTDKNQQSPQPKTFQNHL